MNHDKLFFIINPKKTLLASLLFIDVPKLYLIYITSAYMFFRMTKSNKIYLISPPKLCLKYAL